MTAIDVARKLMRLRTGANRYDAYKRLWQQSGGLVFESPTCVLWGKSCRRPDKPQALTNDAIPDGDCWLVWLAVGDMREILDIIPEPKKWVAFWRRGQSRVYQFGKLITRLSHHVAESP